MLKRFFLFLVISAVMVLPAFVHAQTTSSTTTSSTVHLINPLGETDPRVLIGNVISGILSIIGSVALLMFFYGGVLWVTAMGEQKKVDRGKHILVWTTLGLGVIAGSYVFVNAVIKAFTTGSA